MAEAAPTAAGETLVSQTGDPVRDFYAMRGDVPFWLDASGGATLAAKALLDRVSKAAGHALPAERYGVGSLRAQLATGEGRPAHSSASLETALTELFVTFARDLSSGIVDPSSLGRNFDLEVVRPDPRQLLATLAAAPDVGALLDGLQPADPAYPKLLDLYAEMQAIAASGDWGGTIDPGPSLALGDRSPRVAQLRARLTAIGDLAAPEAASLAAQKLASNEVATDAVAADAASQAARPTDSQVFDPALERAVRDFQARHGLNTDGVVGPATLAALNTSAAERAAQVAVNLERLRWFDIARTGRSIVINTAAFSMMLLEDGAPRFQTRTVVGKARRFQTPEFNDELEFMVVNPYWNVPYSIASKEILPLLQENPAYLEENNMELLNADLPSSLIDWSTVTRGSFPGRIRQRPGPGNALGDVKFLFPNHHAIYMHDTPARRLFARDRRDYSHGCVRLEDPYEFAHLLLSLQSDVSDPIARFDQLRARHGEQWIRLDEKIPVYLTYRTAWIGDDGTHQFRADVYGRDKAIADALEKTGVTIGG